MLVEEQVDVGGAGLGDGLKAGDDFPLQGESGGVVCLHANHKDNDEHAKGRSQHELGGDFQSQFAFDQCSQTFLRISG